jgi:hypothetical protein
MKSLLIRTLLGMEIVLSCSILSAQESVKSTTASVSFPDNSQAVSPDGRYVVVDVDSLSEHYHTVFLTDLQFNTRRKLFNYDRNIDVLWSPDSKLLAVTDYGDSNFSRCSVISVDEKIAVISVLDQLFRSLSGSDRKRLERLQNNHHFYVAASAWTGPEKLRLKVWGNGDADPKGFIRYYTVLIHPSQP